MKPTEKLMYGLLPMVVIFCTIVMVYFIHRYFAARGNFPIFKTSVVMLVLLGALYGIGVALGLK